MGSNFKWQYIRRRADLYFWNRVPPWRSHISCYWRDPARCPPTHRPPTPRHRPRRIGFVRLAQEAQGRCTRSLIKTLDREFGETAAVGGLSFCGASVANAPNRVARTYSSFATPLIAVAPHTAAKPARSLARARIERTAACDDYPRIVPLPRPSLLCSIMTVSCSSAIVLVNSAFINSSWLSACMAANMPSVPAGL
jgi:hypothetical protein